MTNREKRPCRLDIVAAGKPCVCSRWPRRWYLLVIILLYVGLLASFSLNVSLLLRKQPLAPPREGDMVAESGAEAGKGKGEFFSKV